MDYPPPWRHVTAPGAAAPIMAAHPFAHLLTAQQGLCATRLPFIAECEGDQPLRLRAHLNRQNPQAAALDGAQALVVFSGPSTYVSPHWRIANTRAGTYDYEEVQVRGAVRIVDDIDFFRHLIDDLSRLIEPQYAEVGDYPIWQTSMAPAGYIERLYPHIVAFVIEVEAVRTVAKLHQQFPEEDRRSIADHLSRSHRDDARAIAAKIRKLEPR